jgi:hypothetical protein
MGKSDLALLGAAQREAWARRCKSHSGDKAALQPGLGTINPLLLLLANICISSDCNG